MKFRRTWSVPLVCVAALMSSALARNVFVIPNTTGTPQTISVLSGDNFVPVGTISNVANVFQAISTPSGDKVYLITRTASPAVIVVNGANFTPTGKLFNFGLAPVAAAMTPDGRRLVVIADTVHIIDVATDTELNNGFSVAVPSTLADLAISPDSTMAYILSKPFSGASSQISILDLTTNNLAAVNPISIPGQTTTLTIGPNGLLYATAPNNFYEIDPRTLQLRADIGVSGTPGKPVFTSDGLGAVIANQTPSTGSQLSVVNLGSRQVFPISVPDLGFNSLDQLILGTNGHIFGFSSGTSTIFDITPSTLHAAAATFGVLSLPGTVQSVVASPETTPRTLFVSTPTSIYRVDLANSQVTGTQPAATTNSTLVFSGPASRGTAAQLIAYNNGETTGVNTLFVPIVVRAVDQNGLPLANVQVTFSTASGAVLNPATTTTNASGFATTNVTAPAGVGAITLTASAPGSSATPVTINLNVAATSPGGGGPGGTGALLSIVGGNGQLVREQFVGAEELVVQVNDASGKPVPGADVTFNLTSGNGALRAGDLSATTPTCRGAGQSIPCTTDDKGQARVIFFASSVPQGSSYTQSTISATSGSSTVSFTEITYLGTQQGQQLPSPSVFEITPGFGDRTITGRVGQIIPGAIQVRVVTAGGPQLGFPIPGVGLHVVSDNPDTSASCQGPGGFVLSDANGVATCDLVISGKPGTALLSAIVGSANVRPSIVLNVTAGAPAKLNITSGNNQSGNVGTKLSGPLTVQVTDQFGTPLPGTTVTFEVATPGAVTLSATSVQTDNNGNASVTATLGNTPGPQIVRARVGTTLVSSFTLTAKPLFGGIVALSGGTQTATINKAFTAPLVVKVTDTNGNPLPNSPVSFAVISGSATLSANSATTDTNGNASVTVTAGNTAGPVVVRATAGNFTTNFNLTVQPPLSISSVINGANFIPGLAPGAIATILGNGIAGGNTGVVLPAAGGALPTSLGGVSVTINGFSVPLFSVSNVNGSEQINFQVPFDLAPGNANVIVNTPAGSTTAAATTVQALQPAIFENVDASNNRYAVAQRLSDGAYITPTNPVARGQRVRVYLTGLGQTSPTAVTNQAGTPGQRVLAPVIVGINNAGVLLESAEYVPGANGVYMVTFTVPTTLNGLPTPTGPYVPLSFGAIAPDGRIVYSQGSTISIQ
jgi:uncharacterized protein (TIGR03437 family)